MPRSLLAPCLDGFHGNPNTRVDMNMASPERDAYAIGAWLVTSSLSPPIDCYRIDHPALVGQYRVPLQDNSTVRASVTQDTHSGRLLVSAIIG